jgi:DNA-binding beta-propeller fold protein YncE
VIGGPTGLVVIVVLAVLTLNIYLATLPAAQTVRSLGAISVPAPFRVTRPFIDYMEIHGQRLYVAFASHNLVGVIDTTTSTALGAIEGLPRVHGVAIVPERGLGFASAGADNTLIDPQTEAVVTSIDLGGEPEFCQADPQSGLIYRNLEDTSEVVVIDPQKRTVIRRYKLAPGEGPTGLALDAVNRRLFSATGNKKLLVLN